MFAVVQLRNLFLRQLKISSMCLHTRVSSRIDIDTGIEGFEKNKKKYRFSHKNPLLSWLDNAQNLFSDQELTKLYDEFKTIVNDMTTIKWTNGGRRGNKRTKDMMEYVLPWTPVCAVQFLIGNAYYTKLRQASGKTLANEEEHYQLSFKLAWALEMIARTPYMIDDAIDEGTVRQNLPCWKTVPGVGLREVNDIAILIHGGYSILTKYFLTNSIFPYLIKLVSECFITTAVGENNLFLLSCEINSPNYVYEEKDFIRAKVLLNAILLPTMPVVAAMVYNGINDSALIQKAVEIGDMIATYYTKGEDWVDVYGGNAGNERESRDIQEGYPSWLFYAAFKHANENQRNHLIANYGKEDPAAVKEVLKIYSDLHVSEIVYEMGEKDLYKLELQISQLPRDTYPKTVWFNLLNHYKQALLGQAARC